MEVTRLPLHPLDFKTVVKEGGVVVTIIGTLVTVLEAAVIVAAMVGEIRAAIVSNVVKVGISAHNALPQCKTRRETPNGYSRGARSNR